MSIRSVGFGRGIWCRLLCCVIIANARIDAVGGSGGGSDNRSCEWQDSQSSGECDVRRAAIVASLLAGTLAEESVQMDVSGTADITQSVGGQVAINSTLTVTRSTDAKCPALPDGAARLTQSQLVDALTASCRYDRQERPAARRNGTLVDGPVEVYARTYIYSMQVLASSDLQFSMQGLLQLRYLDPRLAFDVIAPNRSQPVLGETQLRDRIWVPHIFLANEQGSSVLGAKEQSVRTSIAADGTVIIASRVQATLFCWMNLAKFPFDEQYCSTNLESWMYNASELMLHWEQQAPIDFDASMELTGYDIEYAWCNASIISADLKDLRHGAFAGNYSSLSFTVHLTRQVGYYMMKYFVPSMMIVAISWVSFWLQGDQTAGRTTLGTTTMLAFITLSTSQDKSLPKVSYIKVSEIWFVACALFIFGSLVEFAFANTIWCRNLSLHLEKPTSRHILRSTLTPSRPSSKLHRTDEMRDGAKKRVTKFLTIEAPTIIVTAESPDSITGSLSSEDIAGNINVESDDNDCSIMSPHEASLWIDRKARFAFPLSFLIFNAIFWTLVYCL